MSGRMYRIGEAATLLNLKSYVLRFWETAFPQLEPVRTDKGQRLYTEKHLELLKIIKYLLHERGLTIDGARRILNSPQHLKFLYMKSTNNAQTEPPASFFTPDQKIENVIDQTNLSGRYPLLLEDTINELEQIKELLTGKINLS